jgi:predicted XRE-type DNA-binding protein
MIVRARFREQEPVPGVAASNEARALALVYAIELAVESGRYRSMAEVARALGLSRSRLSQVMRRRWANIEEQERSLRTSQTAR